MEKIIIGIHGLANKPNEDILTKWWKMAIDEGLNTNYSYSEEYNFDMVYWANYLYKYQIHQDEDFSFDSLYNQEPYIAAEDGTLQVYEEGIFSSLRAFGQGHFGAAADFLKESCSINGMADWLLGKYLKDLAFYYSDSQTIVNDSGEPVLARTLLREVLKEAILSHHDKQIMLIAHSMGSIIAYDVLRELGHSNPDLNISHFVTIGSPLGLPHVKVKIKLEAEDDIVRTPSIVNKSWINFSDMKDCVALDFRLSDDYEANKSGIKVTDDLVSNSYTNGKDENPHKSYGYLRTPEVSKHIIDFLKN